MINKIMQWDLTLFNPIVKILGVSCIYTLYIYKKIVRIVALNIYTGKEQETSNVWDLTISLARRQQFECYISKKTPILIKLPKMRCSIN